MNFFQQSYSGRNNWWRYAIMLGVFLMPFLYRFIKSYVTIPLLSFFPEDVSIRFAIKEVRFIILVFLFLGLFSVIHQRKYRTLITSRKKFDFLRFWLSFSVWGVLLMLVFSVMVMLNPDIYKWNFELFPFLKLFLLSIVFIPFRVFFITIFINSYTLQFLTKFFKKPFIALIISVLLFTIFMYMRNKSAINASGNQLILYYLTLGLMIYLIIILDSGIEIITGLFLASSLISRLFVTYSTNKIQLDAIFLKTGSKDVILFSYVIPFICCPLFFVFLFKVYQWKNWKEQLFTKN